MKQNADNPFPIATNGEIAAANLQSARRNAWTRFGRDPGSPGTAESLLDLERLALQFFGDTGALDALKALADQFGEVDGSFRAAQIRAEVASAAHRFAEARSHLARAAHLGMPDDAVERQLLAIDQACGLGLDDVLAARCRIAAQSGSLEDLVPLGALLADLEEFDQANQVYQQALYTYAGTSPFPLAWVCFQLGMLWGELALDPDPTLAALWYGRAIAYLPTYTRARVHLAEVFLRQDRPRDAEAVLIPALRSPDPEVPWRLADAMLPQDRFAEATKWLHVAGNGFDKLLKKHLLAFADHAAEFYAGSGNDNRRALELAGVNAANRPTNRAVSQRDAIALRCQ